jgi:putative aldouronate transport system permease protein
MKIGKLTLSGIGINLLLGILACLMLLPFLNVVAVSFSSSQAINAGKVLLWPVDLDWSAYRNILKDGQVFHAMKNSVLITVVGTALNIILTIIAAYPLSKTGLMGRKIFLGMIIFTMVFPGGIIPHYLWLKTLGLTNSYWSVWLYGFISVYNLFVMKSFMEGLPEEIEESASMDGANDLMILFKIVIPLCMPVIAALMLFYAVAWWNSYYTVLIFITQSDKLSLTVKLYQMIEAVRPELLQNGDSTSANSLITPEGIRAATVVIASLPILIVYPFLQKYFAKGVLIGSVKG